MTPESRTNRSYRPLAAALFALAALATALADSPRRITGAAPVAPVGGDIAGGVEAAPGAWPWQVAILDAGNGDLPGAQFCGGTLIDPEWVAARTAAGAWPE